MELSQGKHEGSKFDVISNMPDNVVTNILNRLPLQDAMMTSILSRDWRYKWMLLSQLVFDEEFYQYLVDNEYENYYGSIISRFLFHLKGAITKFVLYIDVDCSSVNVDDISHWILFLSRNGIKDIILEKCWNENVLELPTHLFSCLELKHLKLRSFCFNPPASFHGFPNLLSLELHPVLVETVKFNQLFAWCPVLEILDLNATFTDVSSKVKLADIAKLANLKKLDLFLSNIDNTCSSCIFELVGSLLKLQDLYLDFTNCKDDDKNRLPTTFPCLKTLELSTINLSDGIMLSFAFEMIKSLPNLQTFEITKSYWDADPPLANTILKIEYNTLGPLQLRNVAFDLSKGSENEVCLIKYLLACSPFLKNFVIGLGLIKNYKEKFRVCKELLKLHRASPIVDIDLS